MKKSEKKNRPKLSRIIITLSLVILAVAVAVQFAVISLLSNQMAFERASRTWDTKLIYACYNHKIYPCDEDGVAKWNEQNPSQAITPAYLKDPNF